MKRFGILFFCAYSALLSANPYTFSKDRLEAYYDSYLCEGKATLGAYCPFANKHVSPLPTPPAPVSVPNPTAPPAMMGLLPFVITNNSGLPDSEVFVLVQGRVPIGGPQVFVNFNMSGVGTNHVVMVGDNGSTYTHPLSYFPTSSGGRVFYLPMIDSFLVLISLQSPLNIPVIAAGIQDPAFNNPADPNNNYSIIWDQVEGAYVSTSPNVNVDATAVSFFSIPLYLYLSTPGPGTASNCGLTQSRSTVLSYLQSVFATVPPSTENTQWQNLMVPGGSTVYRALSPGNAISAGFFDQNYLNNAAAYGYSYIADIWTGPLSFYRIHQLSIEIPGGTVYTGGVQSDNSFRFTSGPNVVTLTPPVQGPPYTSSTTWQILSGKLAYTATIDADGIQVSKAFAEAVVAGILPTTSLVNASLLTTLSVFRPYYQINPNLQGLGQNTGPWYDLYSQALHACGLIYTYAYDEPLWPEVLLASPTLLSNTYIGITIGNCSE